MCRSVNGIILCSWEGTNSSIVGGTIQLLYGSLVWVELDEWFNRKGNKKCHQLRAREGEGIIREDKLGAFIIPSICDWNNSDPTLSQAHTYILRAGWEHHLDSVHDCGGRGKTGTLRPGRVCPSVTMDDYCDRMRHNILIRWDLFAKGPSKWHHQLIQIIGLGLVHISIIDYRLCGAPPWCALKLGPRSSRTQRFSNVIYHLTWQCQLTTSDQPLIESSRTMFKGNTQVNGLEMLLFWYFMR